MNVFMLAVLLFVATLQHALASDDIKTFTRFTCEENTSISEGHYQMKFVITANGKIENDAYLGPQPLYDATVTFDAQINDGKPQPTIKHKRVVISEQLICNNTPESLYLLNCYSLNYSPKHPVSISTILTRVSELSAKPGSKYLRQIPKTMVHLDIISKELADALSDKEFVGNWGSPYILKLVGTYAGIPRAIGDYNYAKPWGSSPWWCTAE